jgi:micrococcal nuclease
LYNRPYMNGRVCRLSALVVVLTMCIAGCSQAPMAPDSGQPPVMSILAARDITAGAAEGSRVKATVTRVIDGDTIEVNIGGAVHRLRYIGVDAPEPDSVDTNTRNIALKSAGNNNEMVGGKTVELEKDVSETDRYGRLLRYVYVDGLMANAELVRLGYAQATPYPPDTRYQGKFSELQRSAQQARAGMWGSSGYYTAPSPTEKGLYVGSKKSDKYHYPTCIWAQQISAENETWFDSIAEARSKSYVPCKVCRPPQ